jgi:hypothetical protein
MRGFGSIMSDLQRLISLPSLDDEYKFGQPTVHLNPLELARLMLLRSTLGETRAQRAAEYIGDRNAA